MCRHAVDLSKGGLIEINMEHFGNDSLFSYIAERSRYMRRLKLVMFYPLTGEGFVNAVIKIPFLEDLEISHCYPQIDVKAIGQSCSLLKTLKLNSSSFSKYIVCDDDALAIAETMPQLDHLEIFGNRLTNSGLNVILDNCHHLEHLDLRCCFNINFVGDLEKRCSERIKDLKRPDDSVPDSPVNDTFSDLDSEEEECYYSYDIDDIESVYGDVNDHSDISNLTLIMT